MWITRGAKPNCQKVYFLCLSHCLWYLCNANRLRARVRRTGEDGLDGIYTVPYPGQVVQRLSLTSLVGKEWLTMATGKVKWFNDQKGFGFIAADNNRDVFVHHTVIEGDGYKTLEDGETVEYEAEDGPKGLKATKVKRTVAQHA